jgi:hypothetical protein
MACLRGRLEGCRCVQAPIRVSSVGTASGWLALAQRAGSPISPSTRPARASSTSARSGRVVQPDRRLLDGRPDGLTDRGRRARLGCGQARRQGRRLRAAQRPRIAISITKSSTGPVPSPNGGLDGTGRLRRRQRRHRILLLAEERSDRQSWQAANNSGLPSLPGSNAPTTDADSRTPLGRLTPSNTRSSRPKPPNRPHNQLSPVRAADPASCTLAAPRSSVSVGARYWRAHEPRRRDTDRGLPRPPPNAVQLRLPRRRLDQDRSLVDVARWRPERMSAGRARISASAVATMPTFTS